MSEYVNREPVLVGMCGCCGGGVLMDPMGPSGDRFPACGRCRAEIDPWSPDFEAANDRTPVAVVLRTSFPTERSATIKDARRRLMQEAVGYGANVWGLRKNAQRVADAFGLSVEELRGRPSAGG